MKIVIRDIKNEDLEDVYHLNQQNIPKVGDITKQGLKWLYKRACHKKLVTNEGEIIAFILCFFPGQPYESLNYQWFSKNFENFLYIDRIAINESVQRKGVGSLLYVGLEKFCKYSSVEYLCCEVNTKPLNKASLKFHKKQKFVKVGEQDTEGGEKTVAFLLKKI